MALTTFLVPWSSKIYAVEVERLFIEWFFCKAYCFSKGLQSTIPGDQSDLMVGLTFLNMLKFAATILHQTWKS